MFTVVDKKTGEYPNLEQIVLKEDWAKNLIHCDMEGFFLSEDGNLILADECGNFAYPQPDRFEVIQDNWTNCEEELPDIGTWCLVFGEPCFYAIAQYQGEGVWKKDGGLLFGETAIDHWMPLPPEPKEE